jgi:uncharacterized protein (TIGR02145 family)
VTGYDVQVRRVILFVMLAACRDESRPPAAAVVDIDPHTKAPPIPTGGPQAQPLEPNEIIDVRDGERYHWVELAGRRWLTESSRWAAPRSWCYENDREACKKYGRLYEWDTAMEACPRGWHLASEDEWGRLESINMGDLLDGGSSGFAIQLGGWRDQHGTFMQRGEHFYFWTSTEYDADTTRARIRWNLSNDNLQIATDQKDHGYSARCIEDQ